MWMYVCVHACGCAEVLRKYLTRRVRNLWIIDMYQIERSCFRVKIPVFTTLIGPFTRDMCLVILKMRYFVKKLCLFYCM